MRRPGRVEDAELSRLVSCSAIAQKMGKVELWVFNGAGNPSKQESEPIRATREPITLFRLWLTVHFETAHGVRETQYACGEHSVGKSSTV